MDLLYDQFETEIDALTGRFKLEEIKFNPLYENEHLINAVNTIWESIEESQFKIDKSSILTTFLIQFNLKLYKDHIHENEEEPEFDIYIKSSLILFDFAHYLDNQKEQGFFYMQIFYTVMTSLTLSEQLLNTFCDIYFAKDNEIRRLKLTHNNKLLGKMRPGSKLLSLYKQISSKTSAIYYENDISLQKLRELIYGSLEISDKLSQSFEWKINSMNDLYKSAIDFSATLKSKQASTPLGFLLLNCSRIWKLFNSNSLDHTIKEINDSRDISGNKPNDLGLNQYPQIIKGLKEALRLINKDNKSQSSKDYEVEWVFNNDSFLIQISNYNKYWSLFIQMLIICNILNEMTFENMNPIFVNANRDIPKKFKKPDQLSKLLTNTVAKRKFKDWKGDLFNIARGKFHYEELDYIFNYNEKTWTLMKLKLFNHPNVESIQKISENHKRSLDEYLENNNEDRILKKPKYRAIMGTNKLTTLWRTPTGSEPLKTKIDKPFNILETIKDDIYFVKGKYLQLKEEKEKEAKDLVEFNQSLEEYNRMNWKGMRIARNAGHWLKFANCDDEDIGVDGIWN